MKDTVTDVNVDQYLLGENLGNRIKNVKNLEGSVVNIKAALRKPF